MGKKEGVGIMTDPYWTNRCPHEGQACEQCGFCLDCCDCDGDLGSCDVCDGQSLPVTLIKAYGLETWACDACRGEEQCDHCGIKDNKLTPIRDSYPENYGAQLMLCATCWIEALFAKGPEQ